MNYCAYCKDEIRNGEAITIGKTGVKYHAECYKIITTYTDDFGTYSTDEFGNDISDDLGY